MKMGGVLITEPEAFDLNGPLPWGRLAIEASAGTGKTHTLCHLAVRYIAEADVAASAILLVTFTRAATAELRSRIREAIRDEIRRLEREVACATPDNEVSNDLEHRLKNLRNALTDFDSITISTIHSFATQAITAIGVTSKLDPPNGPTSEDTKLAESACTDAVVRAAASGVDRTLLPDSKALLKAVNVATNSPDTIIEPPELEGEPTAHTVLASLVRTVVTTLRMRRQASDSASFDDVLSGLREMVQSPDGASAVALLRDRYRVVMIDEFQDTDPVQWGIFGTIFGDREVEPQAGREPTALVLVGDPKQAIYSFRGADISTYSGAVSEPGTRSVALATNWRSDGQLVDALGTLFSGVSFGRGIDYLQVGACEKNTSRVALTDGEPVVPVRFRLALGESIPRNTQGISAPEARDAVWNDVVSCVMETLASTTIPDVNGTMVRVQPSDIAILVNSGKNALLIQELLASSGIPAVLSRASKVLDSEAADQWRWLLDALSNPTDVARARRFAIGWFMDTPIEEIDSPDDALMVSVFELFSSWVDELQRHGVTTFVQRVLDDSEIIPRVLLRPNGDRLATDLTHVGELMQAAGPHATVQGLLEVLRPDDRSADEQADDEQARRIETEDSSVQIMTVWVSKGLEFPIVMAPTLFMEWNDDPPVVVHDSTSGKRILDLSGAAAEESRKVASLERSIGERLRLSYVALTRASHQVTVWWATPNHSKKSALSRLLFARDDTGEVDQKALYEDKVEIPTGTSPKVATKKAKGRAKSGQTADGNESDDLDTPSDTDKEPWLKRTHQGLWALVERSGGLIEVAEIGMEPVPSGSGSRRLENLREWGPATDGSAASPALSAQELTHKPDRSSGRWSFSAITAHEDLRSTAEDPSSDDSGANDEKQVGIDRTSPGTGTGTVAGTGTGTPPEPPITSSDSPGTTSQKSSNESVSALPLGWLPAGASFGTLVHTIYEHLDFTEVDPSPTIRTVAENELAWRDLDLTPPLLDGTNKAYGLDLLADGVQRTLATPLGSLFDYAALNSITQSNRLNEMSFELLLDAERTSYESPHLDDRAIGQVLVRWLDPTTALGGWAAELASGAFGVTLGGHLTGSIDAIFRVRGPNHDRFVVTDYKTNRLSAANEPPRPEHYDFESMTRAMVEHHYPLQALLYSVALHRYLRGRLSDYDPSLHLGGVCYLFVRGMVGPDTPVIDGHSTGVWSWVPPAGLIVELSDLLAGTMDTAEQGSQGGGR